MMRRFLASLAISLCACGSAQPQHATDKEIRNALRRADIKSWHAADLKGAGRSSILVFSENGSYSTVNILERKGGKLISHMQDTIRSGNDPGYVVERIAASDMGRDGRNEVEVTLRNGRRIYYIWNGRDYAASDAARMHGGTGHYKPDEVFYKDVNGDGTEEAAVICANNTILFGTYAWRHGWVPFRDSYISSVEEDYKAASRREDALVMKEMRQTAQNRIRKYFK